MGGVRAVTTSLEFFLAEQKNQRRWMFYFSESFGRRSDGTILYVKINIFNNLTSWDILHLHLLCRLYASLFLLPCLSIWSSDLSLPPLFSLSLPPSSPYTPSPLSLQQIKAHSSSPTNKRQPSVLISITFHPSCLYIFPPFLLPVLDVHK